MAAQIKSSFIPKKTLAKAKEKVSSARRGSGGGSSSSGSGGSVNLFMAAGVLIFVGAGIVAGGLFGYKLILQKDIREKSEALEAAEQEVSPELVQELQRLDVRFTHAERLLAEHEALTPFFDFLEQQTIRTIRFRSFQYSKNNDSYSTTFEGEAENYMSLALQSDILNDKDAIISATFSNLALNEDGNVNFKMTAQVNPSVFSYTSQFDGANASDNSVTETP